MVSTDVPNSLTNLLINNNNSINNNSNNNNSWNKTNLSKKQKPKDFVLLSTYFSYLLEALQWKLLPTKELGTETTISPDPLSPPSCATTLNVCHSLSYTPDELAVP